MSELRLHRFDEVQEFEDVVGPFLLSREAENNVVLVVCNQIKQRDYTDFWLTAVTRLGAARIVDSAVVGQEGDVLTFTAATDALDALTERLEAGKDH